MYTERVRASLTLIWCGDGGGGRRKPCFAQTLEGREDFSGIETRAHEGVSQSCQEPIEPMIRGLACDTEVVRDSSYVVGALEAPRQERSVGSAQLRERVFQYVQGLSGRSACISLTNAAIRRRAEPVRGHLVQRIPGVLTITEPSLEQEPVPLPCLPPVEVMVRYYYPKVPVRLTVLLPGLHDLLSVQNEANADILCKVVNLRKPESVSAAHGHDTAFDAVPGNEVGWATHVGTRGMAVFERLPSWASGRAESTLKNAH